MKRNYKKEYIHSRAQALEIAEKYGTAIGIELYLSFSKYGKRVFQDMNKKLYEDAVLDYELGVIDKDEYKILIDAYSIIENSIGEACVY